MSVVGVWAILRSLIAQAIDLPSSLFFETSDNNLFSVKMNDQKFWFDLDLPWNRETVRERPDIMILGDRHLNVSRFRIGHSFDKDLTCSIGIDPMSYIYEDIDDQLVAYAFSQYWVGPTI